MKTTLQKNPAESIAKPAEKPVDSGDKPAASVAAQQHANHSPAAEK